MAPCAGHWGDLPTAWKEWGFLQVGAPTLPLKRSKPQGWPRLVEKAASSAVNNDPRPRGHPPSAPHTPPRPESCPCFVSTTALTSPRTGTLPHAQQRSFLQPGDTGSGSWSSLKLMPPAPLTPWSCHSSTHQALNSLYLQVPHPSPCPGQMGAQRSLQVWGRAVPVPRTGLDPWSAGLSC